MAYLPSFRHVDSHENRGNPAVSSCTSANASAQASRAAAIDRSFTLRGEARSRLLASIARANGMLPAEVYEELWRLSAQTGGGTYVEVGTAHGAATIALALGAQAAAVPVTIHTIDPLGGRFSSRSQFGSPSENQAIVESNFRDAGVDDMISLFVGSSDEFVAAGRSPSRIDMLMLDADGRIDRDFGHFYDQLAPGAPVVIDDANEDVYVGVLHDGTRYVDLKHRLTSLLVGKFQSAGYLEVDRTVGVTCLGRRGNRAMDRREFHGLANACYRELVIATLSDENWAHSFACHVPAVDVHSTPATVDSDNARPPSLARFCRWLSGRRKTG